MLLKLLINNYTIFIRAEEGKLIGRGLLKSEKGIISHEIKEQELSLINGLESIKELLELGNTLQLYQDGLKYNARIGKISKLDPYGNDYFEVAAESEGATFMEELINLNDKSFKIVNGTMEKQKSKKYRLCGETKYSV